MTAPFGPPETRTAVPPLNSEGGRGDLLIPLNCVRGQGV